jgi:invasion protein IalB
MAYSLSTAPFLTTLAMAAALLLPQDLRAQDQGAGDPPAEALPEAFVLATHGDWEVVCQRVAEGPEPCEMYQLLNDETGQPVAEVSIAALPASEAPAAAGATITTPLETLLPTGITFQIDQAAPRREGFRVCVIIGCIARIGFTAEEVAAMKSGRAMAVTIYAFAQPDQPVNLSMSLRGFTAAFDQLQARLAQ